MKAPNLVYILADDMGYGDVSCLNEEARFKTVHLDRMAAGGMRCTDTHSSSAVCTPSRYSILTGRYNWRSVLKKGVTGGYSRPILEPGRLTVASMLKAKGYRTACVGKWHLGLEWRMKDGGIASTYGDEDKVDFAARITDGPLDHGFDTFFGISASLDMPPYVYIENDRSTSVPTRKSPLIEGKRYMRTGRIGDDFKPEEVLPKLTGKVERLIDEYAGADDPFFIYFPLPAPHTPILPSEAFQGKSGANEYGDFCLQVDDTVGRVLAALERHGLADNTIVVFAADNGCSPMADFDELAACGHRPSYVFRGHKADIYEGGHRIPFLVRWPAVIEPGRESNQTVCLADLAATMAEITGCALPDNAAEDSVSNLPVWNGTATGPVREATVHHSINGSFSIRKGKWKLEMCPGSGGWSHPRPGKECEGLPPVQLYDLSADISEHRNVGDQHPEVVEELTALLTRYVAEGRSTPGAPRPNTGGTPWEQLWWMRTETHQPTREEALTLLREYNGEPLVRHALAVEAVMRHIARKHGEDEDAWGLVGLIHDLDYERYPEQHCTRTAEILREQGWPEEVIRAAVSHGWGICSDVEPRSRLEKTLYAIDELTGLVAACALVRPSKSVMDLTAKSVRKKWKQKSFAAGADRDLIERGAERLGVSVDELIDDTIAGMREVASEIGLGA